MDWGFLAEYPGNLFHLKMMIEEDPAACRGRATRGEEYRLLPSSPTPAKVRERNTGSLEHSGRVAMISGFAWGRPVP